jgi:hypothetical protein
VCVEMFKMRPGYIWNFGVKGGFWRKAPVCEMELWIGGADNVCGEALDPAIMVAYRG